MYHLRCSNKYSSNDAAPPGLSGGHKRSTAERLEHDTNEAAATVARVEEQAAQQQAAPVQAGQVVAPGHAGHAAPVQDAHVDAPVQVVLAAPQWDTQVGAQAVQVQNETVQAVPETTSDAASGSGNKDKSWEDKEWSNRGWYGWKASVAVAMMKQHLEAMHVVNAVIARRMMPISFTCNHHVRPHDLADTKSAGTQSCELLS